MGSRIWYKNKTKTSKFIKIMKRVAYQLSPVLSFSIILTFPSYSHSILNVFLKNDSTIVTLFQLCYTLPDQIIIVFYL